MEERFLVCYGFKFRLVGENLKLIIGKGWLNYDEIWRNYFLDIDFFFNVVYIYCYDLFGMKFFVVGGFFFLGFYGNYVGFWS